MRIQTRIIDEHKETQYLNYASSKKRLKLTGYEFSFFLLHIYRIGALHTIYSHGDCIQDMVMGIA